MLRLEPDTYQNAFSIARPEVETSDYILKTGVGKIKRKILFSILKNIANGFNHWDAIFIKKETAFGDSLLIEYINKMILYLK